VRKLFRFSFFCSVLCSAVYGQPTGSISGIIVDESGKGVADAQVVVQMFPTFTRSADGHVLPGAPGFNTILAVDSDGRFSMTGLSAGTYHICGYGTTASQVSSCDWSGVASITLESGQALNITRTVVTGVLIAINVADPNLQLGSGKRFYLGLGDKSFYQPAKLVSQTSTGRAFQIAVPRQRMLSMFISSDVPLRVQDSLGTDLEINRLTTKTISTDVLAQLTINLTIQ
jgi:hypothetical protein